MRSRSRGSGTGSSSSTRTSARRERAQATARRYERRPRGDVGLGLDRRPRQQPRLHQPAGRRMVGIGLDEDITGRRTSATSRPRGPAGACRSEGLAAARRDGAWRGDLARLHRDGHEIPVSQVIVAHLAADGAVDFYATIARDMTRRARRRGGAARERRALPRDVRAGADRRVADRPRGPLPAGQRRVLPDGRPLARGAAAARARGDHPPRRRRRRRATRLRCSPMARPRWCASRSATSTPAGTRSGSR